MARGFHGPAPVAHSAHVLVAALALGALGVFIAACAGASRARRAAVLMLALSSLAITASVPEELVFARGLFALANLLFLMRAIDLVRERESSPFSVRLALMFVVYDARETRACVPRLPRVLFVQGLACATLAVVSLWAALHSARGLFTWLFGTVFVYSSADAAQRLTTAFHRARGVVIPPQHENPILSRSVAEFWSRRWNINVSTWLRRHWYRPLAERGYPRAGLAAAFFVSALFHWWLIHVPLGWSASLPMAVFFLVQAALIFVERALGLGRRATWQRHAWTVGVMLSTSPLFVSPFLSVFASLV